MKSLAAEFVAYVAAVYPEQPAVDSDQRRQLRDAFHAGALASFNVEPGPLVAELLEYRSASDQRAAAFEAQQGGAK